MGKPRLSYTALSAYERCPLSYRFQYVDGLAPEVTPHLVFGRAVHSALQWFYDRDVPVPPTLEELLSYLESCWSEEGFSSREESLLFLDHAREVISCFYRHNVDSYRLPVAVEHRFELDMGDILLTGVIDRVDRHEDGRYEVLDYKTNRRLPELSKLKGDLQLPIYQIACRQVFGINPSKLTFYFVVPNQRYSTRPMDEESLRVVMARLKEVGSRIAQGEFPARPGRLCPWCDYYDICPEGQREPSGEQPLLARYRALLRRKRALEKMIEELEEEMRDQGLAFIDGDDEIPTDLC
ncbi:MAG: PD-(D/E)XK nuclease family protein [Candidatus Geothermincolales bacterium]